MFFFETYVDESKNTENYFNCLHWSKHNWLLESRENDLPNTNAPRRSILKVFRLT